jgi:hypothetical protein
VAVCALTPDAAVPDAGEFDAGAPDAGRADAGSSDAGSPDAGNSDAGGSDAGTSTDAGSSDAGSTLSSGCRTDGWCWNAPFPQGNDLTAAWVTSPTDAWFAGQNVLLHFDGLRFAHANAPPSFYRALWASSANDVWAVGSNTTIVRHGVDLGAGGPGALALD